MGIGKVFVVIDKLVLKFKYYYICIVGIIFAYCLHDAILNIGLVYLYKYI